MRSTLMIVLTAVTFAASAAAAASTLRFSKQKLDGFFYAEGGTIADFNGDGSADLVAGPRIFLGPDFKKNIVYRAPHAFDRLSYSNNFLT
jgi:hypothetical protein